MVGSMPKAVTGIIEQTIFYGGVNMLYINARNILIEGLKLVRQIQNTSAVTASHQTCEVYTLRYLARKHLVDFHHHRFDRLSQS